MKRVHVPIDSLVQKSNQAGDARGIRCPKCHCVQFHDGKNVRNTVPIDGGTRRYRVCRNCGTTWATIEQ